MQRDMTQGNPRGSILLYALPLLAGNILQQLYNVIGAAILGRTIGKNALAAVGSSGSIITLMTSVIIGLCLGGGVVISRLYGARDIPRLRKAVATSFFFSLGVSVLLAAAIQIFLPAILQAYRMPQEIIGDASAYLRIVALGLPLVCVYNSTAFVLRAVGDSRSPLLFLAMALVLNIALDLIAVLGLGMATRGVAVATVISQGVSAICLSTFALRRLDVIRGMSWKPYFNREVFFPIAHFGIWTSLQQSAMSFGGMLVSGLVNSFGVSVVAAFTACNRIDNFIHLPLTDLSNSLMTYVAQNVGAGKTERIRAGVRFTILAILCYTSVISIAALCFSVPLLTMFIDPGETEVLAIGRQYLSIVSWFYIFIGILQLFYGYFRGIGKPYLSLVLSIASLGTRVVVSYTLAALTGEVNSIWWAIPIGWGFADVVGISLYLFTKGKLYGAAKEEAESA